MAGYMDFSDGSVLTGDQLDQYLMRQTVPRFATTTALTTALDASVRQLGMVAWADDVQVMYLWNGSNWIPWQSTEKTTFTATFTAGGSSITYGNAVVTSKWWYSGGMVQWNYHVVVGSTSNLGAGNYAWTLPIAVRAGYDQDYLGSLAYFDTSAGTTFHRACCTLGSTTSFGAVAEAGQRMGAAAPVAWAIGDVFGFNLRYPPATSSYL